MNTKTGKVYETDDAIESARARGETLVPLGPAAARRIAEGRALLAQKKREERSKRRLVSRARQVAKQAVKSDKKRRAEKASRKRNRA